VRDTKGRGGPLSAQQHCVRCSSCRSDLRHVFHLVPAGDLQSHVPPSPPTLFSPPTPDQGQPLVLIDYIGKRLSRHGKGANSIFYFGNKITVNTKAAGSDEMVTIRADYEEWLRRDRMARMGNSDGDGDNRPFPSAGYWARVRAAGLFCVLDRLGGCLVAVEIAVAAWR
jgi:hypothetical protein